MKDQFLIEAMANALILGTGFVRISNGPMGMEFSSVDAEDYKYLTVPPPPPEAMTDAEKTAYSYGWLKAMEVAGGAQIRLYDLLLGGDGQAWKEAERYLSNARPDLWDRLLKAKGEAA